MVKLTIYSTTHCHLCEQAEVMLNKLADKYDIQWQIVEISEQNELIERYGLTIPVVLHMGNLKELNWPFSYADLEAFTST
ncbi:MAG: glutaredoxin family protein [Betaproteobacteria bacterium]|nr:glutaredoxin family protein [Betaproteobacteria bacterium]